MEFSTLKVIAIPEGEVVQIKHNDTVLWAKPSAYKNWARYSTENDGKTIYNGGLGYKNKTRVRSGGAEAVFASASCTGFIPTKSDDVIGVSGCNLNIKSAANAINVYDENYNCLGQVTENYANAGYGIFASGAKFEKHCWNSGSYTEQNKCYYWTVPNGANIAYIRVTSETNADGSKMIVTVNEEIK